MAGSDFIEQRPRLFVRQRREWAEILIDWETKNQYTVMDATQREVGLVVEKSGGGWGFLARALLRSHRPLEIGVFDTEGALLFRLTRSFFWFFSSLGVTGNEEAAITKRWGGGLREIFTDADTFMIDSSQGQWSGDQRRILLASALSIDFDFFENNQGSGGLLQSGS